MIALLKRTGWDWFRPFHRPVTRVLRRRLARNFSDHPEMNLPPPFETVQLDVERHLHDYLHRSPAEISQIVVVGANEADEVGRMRAVYPRARFLCFEPNPTTFQRLRARFGNDPNITMSPLALSDSPGKSVFHELNIPGAGSLLQPDLEGLTTFVREKVEAASSFEVEVSTLDQEAKNLSTVDLLWMDVQGAEERVLQGAPETLKRTRAVFLEVALTHAPYQGAVLFSNLEKTLKLEGFQCVGLGVDAWNGSGNAFFVKNFERLVCK